MTIDNRSEGQESSPPLPPQPAAQISARGAARRRFTRAGVGASGVLLTLTSQPGMAHTICVAPSAALSGKLKGSHDTHVAVCSARHPDHWKSGSGWPCKLDTKFYPAFACSYQDKIKFGNKTMLEILRSTDSDYTLARYLVAMYLNVLAGHVKFISAKHLNDCWVGLRSSKGSYSPAPGVSWNSADVLLYLYQTMH